MFKQLFVKDDLSGKEVPGKQSCQCGDMECKGGDSCKKSMAKAEGFIELFKANPKGINQYTRGGGKAKPSAEQMPGFSKPFKGPAFAGGGLMHTPVDANGKPTGMAQPYPKAKKVPAGSKKFPNTDKGLEKMNAEYEKRSADIEAAGFKLKSSDSKNPMKSVDVYTHKDGRTVQVELDTDGMSLSVTESKKKVDHASADRQAQVAQAFRSF